MPRGKIAAATPRARSSWSRATGPASSNRRAAAAFGRAPRHCHIDGCPRWNCGDIAMLAKTLLKRVRQLAMAELAALGLLAVPSVHAQSAPQVPNVPLQ